MADARILGAFQFLAPTKFYNRPLAWFTGAMLLASLILGGATRNGYLGDVILQLMSVPVVSLALREIVLRRAAGQLKFPLLFVAAVALIPILQLIPLPLELWKYLPGRELVTEAYVLIGRVQPACPITLTPSATWLSGISLLPPIAVFLAILVLSKSERRYLSVL
ncbi:hypothetical protein I6A62_14450, partial [Frankia sp. AgW1.1]